MKHLKLYNESIRDKIVGPKLEGDKLQIWNLYKICDEFGFNTSKLVNSNGIYWFDIINIRNKWFRISIDDRKNETNPWVLTYEITILDEHNKNKLNFNSSKELTLKLLNLAYGDIDENIKNLNKKIEEYEYLLDANKKMKNKLEKAKKFKWNQENIKN